MFKLENLKNWFSNPTQAIETQPEYMQSQPILDTGSNKLVKTRYGYMIANHNDIFIGRSLIEYGEFSQPELDLLSQIIDKTDNIIEVGSNYGSHTLRLCQLASHGKVFAIEPQRAIFQALCGSIAMNSIFNCYCIQKACSDTDERPIIVPEPDFNKPNNFGGLTMAESSGTSTEETTAKLDTLFRDLNSLKLLKVDAEGMEEKILAGGKNLLKRTRPILFIENDRIEKSESLINSIFNQDYRAFWHISPLYNPSNYRKNHENIFAKKYSSFNMICIPSESDVIFSKLTEIVDPKHHPLSRSK